MKTITVLAVVTALLILLIPSSAAADTADDVKCTGCVGSPDILDFGIKTKDLGVGAVTTPKINDGAVNWKKLASDLQQRIEQLEATVAALEDVVADNTVLKLDGYLDLDTSDPAKPTARFTGVNVQVVNGVGQTESVNGIGNLIVGYNELYEGTYTICSDGFYQTQEDCESAGEIWSDNHKSGSHNLVIGPWHRYSQAGGLIAGYGNAVNRTSGSVPGGWHNVASGSYGSVSGGTSNVASAPYAVVSGGSSNTASGWYSVVSGGDTNEAIGSWSVVSGGYENTSPGTDAVVSGGRLNTASGFDSVVGGGREREATDANDWVAGGLWQDE